MMKEAKMMLRNPDIDRTDSVNAEVKNGPEWNSPGPRPVRLWGDET